MKLQGWKKNQEECSGGKKGGIKDEKLPRRMRNACREKVGIEVKNYQKEYLGVKKQKEELSGVKKKEGKGWKS